MDERYIMTITPKDESYLLILPIINELFRAKLDVCESISAKLLDDMSKSSTTSN